VIVIHTINYQNTWPTPIMWGDCSL